ncbi:hypothetical protein OX284_016625 [Flavobacterium sp. SUN046]|uniref:hypothetical protein n=1 Tax=Flavobacterium sp. SUN046 TaxID=3002440 RepID=UPI002DB56932|nr:hypothetical protein [Flavobacterium sp. SUN046]MEC4051062.1 hypothetical protein [Flavobacterium sp. SUN046]
MQNFTVIRGVKKFALVIIAVMSFGTIHAQSVDHSDCEECNEPFTVGKLKHSIEYGSSVHLRVSNPYGVKITSNLSDFLKGAIQDNENNEVDVYFDTPGTYQITYSSSPMGKYLAYTETVSIEVSPISFKFLMDKAVLSSSIVSGKLTDEVFLTVPVEVKSYNGEKAKYGPFKNSSTGVDGIEVVFDEQVELTPGVHYLKYRLQGTPAGSGPCQIALFNLLGEGYFYNFLISK